MQDVKKDTQKLIDDIYATVDREAVAKMIVGDDNVRAYSSYIAFACPSCGELKAFVRKPSGKNGGNVVKCSRAGCEMHQPMSLIDFVAGTRKARGQSFQNAVSALAGLIGRTYDPGQKYVPFTINRREELQKKIKARVPADYYNPKPHLEKVLQTLQRKTNRKMFEYLKSRGISYELAKKFGVGFAPWNQWPHYNEAGDPVRQWIQGRVVFPVRNDRGELMNLYGRALEDGTRELPKEWKHDFLPGAKGIGNQQDLRQNAVHVVEGYMDLLAIKAADPKKHAAAVFGVHGFNWDLVTAQDVCFAFDPDVAGEAWRDIAKDGLEKGKNIWWLDKETYAGFGDLNEVWAKMGKINFSYKRYYGKDC